VLPRIKLFPLLRARRLATRFSAPATNRGQQEHEARSGAPALEKHCPESVPSFVVLTKNEISDEGAKYEHAGKDIEKN
jgi:hypothetical protein